MTRRALRFILICVALIAALSSCAWGCRATPPAPTPTAPPPPTIAATMTPTATNSPVATFTPIAPMSATPVAPTPETATATPTAVFPYDTPTPTAYVEPAKMLGYHLVQSGDTMFDIGLWWYRGRFFAWGEDVWRPICTANPEIANCRLIYPGDILRIPKLP